MKYRPATISARYLLALNVPLYAQCGDLFGDPGWAKDLSRHTDYLTNLTLLCPIEVENLPPSTQKIDQSKIRIVGVDSSKTLLQAIITLPKLIFTIWREVGRAELLHTGVAGWPIPIGFIAVPIARIRRRKIVLIVESAFWRLRPGAPSPLKRRVIAWVHETLAKACVATGDYVSFTQEEYRESLPAIRAGGGVVAQATWIDKPDMMTNFSNSWYKKLNAHPRILFAGRMRAEKGVDILLDALALCKGVRLQCDFIGDGPKISEIRDACLRDKRLTLLSPMEYGPAFLRFISGYHLVVVPSISDEQPRIVYDAYSQGVPVIVSSTAGLRQCVEDGVTGFVVPVGDSLLLSLALTEAISDLQNLRQLGSNALELAQSMTHTNMHIQRSHGISVLLNN